MSYKNACVIPVVEVGIVNCVSVEVPALSVLTVNTNSGEATGVVTVNVQPLAIKLLTAALLL